MKGLSSAKDIITLDLDNNKSESNKELDIDYNIVINHVLPLLI
jgi:hypothetical protein